MTAFNVVRFRVRPGRDQEFLDAHKKIEATWRGLINANIIKTGDRSYCIIAEWNDMDEGAAEYDHYPRFFSRYARRPRRRSGRYRSGGGAGRLRAEIVRGESRQSA